MCRIAARPSAHLSFPKEGVQQADLDVLGIGGGGGAPSCGQTLSTASACGGPPRAAADDCALEATTEGAASLQSPLSQPRRDRKRSAAAAVDVKMRNVEAGVCSAGVKHEATGETCMHGGGVSAIEPGTPNSGPDGLLCMDEVRRRQRPRALPSPARSAEL